MNVLHIISSLAYGGAERLLVDLALRLPQRGVRVRIVSLTARTPLADQLRSNGVSVDALDFRGTVFSVSALVRARSNLKRIIEQCRPDVVHSHLYLADLLARCTAPASLPTMTTLHNSDAWWKERRRLKSLIKTRVDRFGAALRETRAIAVSDDVARDAQGALCVPEQRCRVIYNGIDIARFPALPRKLDSSPVIIQVGRLYPQKGHATSLKALAVLLRNFPDCRLMLVGEGPEENALRAMAGELGVDRNVDFLGRQNDVAALLGRAHIFWMPSGWEGLPLACLEAMASGLPVVVSAVGGMSALVADGVGCAVKPGDWQLLAETTANLLTGYGDASAMGMRAASSVRATYSIESTTDAYAEAYRDLLSGRW